MKICLSCWELVLEEWRKIHMPIWDIVGEKLIAPIRVQFVGSEECEICKLEEVKK